MLSEGNAWYFFACREIFRLCLPDIVVFHGSIWCYQRCHAQAPISLVGCSDVVCILSLVGSKNISDVLNVWEQQPL